MPRKSKEYGGEKTGDQRILRHREAATEAGLRRAKEAIFKRIDVAALRGFINEHRRKTPFESQLDSGDTLRGALVRYLNELGFSQAGGGLGFRVETWAQDARVRITFHTSFGEIAFDPDEMAEGKEPPASSESE